MCVVSEGGLTGPLRTQTNNELFGTPLLTRLVLRERSSSRRVLICAIGLTLITSIGFVDYNTPAVVSLAVMYVVVVVSVTLLAGFGPGMLTAVASTISWVVGDSALRPDESARTYVVNGTLRLLALTIVVLLVVRLVDAVTRAHRSELRSREFLATAAHQLRTPIAGVRASADALFWVDAPEEQEHLLANLSTESARAGRLIHSLLQVARLDQGEGFRHELVDVRQVVQSEVDRARSMSSPTTEFVVASGDPVPATIDVQATRDALANLLDNARRHAKLQIHVRIESDDRATRVVVADDGPGLPAGCEEQVFDRFVSLDGGGGSGLGLSIARQLIRMQGGDLFYDNGDFVMELPPTPRSAGRTGFAPLSRVP
jgi:signal transduction histidine kinase